MFAFRHWEWNYKLSCLLKFPTQPHTKMPFFLKPKDNTSKVRAGGKLIDGTGDMLGFILILKIKFMV